MIRTAQGDIFEEPADVRVNTVNCVGVMGAGLALAFKTRYPDMYRDYEKACRAGEIKLGKVWEWRTLDGAWIINFPTKGHWREPSRYEDIEAGLRDLRRYLKQHGKVTVAMPAVGCGHGGLDWDRVRELIVNTLSDLEADVVLFEPSSSRDAGERVGNGEDETILEKLKEAGVTIANPGDDAYPMALRGTRATRLFIRGKAEFLDRPLLAVMSSLKPQEREMSATQVCVKECVSPEAGLLVGYGQQVDRPLIRVALERGSFVVICVAEGILNFQIRKDIEDTWDEKRVAVVATEASQHWNRVLAGRAKGLMFDLARAVLISDPAPTWMSAFLRRRTDLPKLFFVDYGTGGQTASEVLGEARAEPVRRKADSGMPNVVALLEILRGGHA